MLLQLKLSSGLFFITFVCEIPAFISMFVILLFFRWEVLRFLMSYMRYYLEEFFFDGFRFNGVTPMIYQNKNFGKTLLVKKIKTLNLILLSALLITDLKLLIKPFYSNNEVKKILLPHKQN